MNSVLTLIANPAAPILDPSMADAARRAIAAAGGEAGDVAWLAPGVACDIAFGGIDPKAAESAARAALGAAPVDIVAQPSAGRCKRLLLADMDSTIVVGETLDAFAAEVGFGERIAVITARSMRGELDFAEAMRERVAILKGASAAVLHKVRDAMEPTAGARALVATMHRSGARTLLVSGGFRIFTAYAGALIGFDEDRGNELEIEGGVLTGKVVEPILGRDTKLATLRAEAARLGLALDATMAVGDGANDLAMIQAAGMGVAFQAKPITAAAARARVDHGDLTALLYMQGYRLDEFAA
ncbi:MAG: phosphoserine phosphatase SerB [Alphaproteobacteria bacterium]|nr:phosphoserine phosphatase SerB [Alphaproteobacteria bacterium]